MTETQDRHSRLAPLPIAEKIRIALLAIKFFSPLSFAEVCGVLGKVPQQGRIVPLEGMDFLNYLDKTGELKEAFRYMRRIRELLTNLAAGNVLSDMGPGKGVMTGSFYYFLRELTKRENEGLWWLAPAFGPEFIHYMLNSITLQITGRDKAGGIVAGTGLVLSPEWLLTCAHVITDMAVDATQLFRGISYSIQEALSHPDIDVGLLRLTPTLPYIPGLTFYDPVVADTIYTLGYPRIPLSREPSLVMHRGEVTSNPVLTFSGRRIFLYSAIARPGNSGGPIISESGQIVGIVSDELSDTTAHSGLPFYGGITASDIAAAVRDLTSSVVIPLEDYR